MKKAEWNSAISEGRKLVRNIATSKWKLGDLAAQFEPKEQDRFAEEIGVPPGKLSQYRRTSQFWTEAKRNPKISWSVFYELMTATNDRKAANRAMKELIDQYGVEGLGARQLRAYLGKPMQAHAVFDTATHEQKIKAASEYMSDPEVAEAVLADRKLAASVTEAMAAVDRERLADQPDRERREAAFGLDAVHSRMLSMAASARSILRELNGLNLTKRQKNELLAELELVHTATGWIESLLTAQFDADEVEAFLAEQS